MECSWKRRKKGQHYEIKKWYNWALICVEAKVIVVAPSEKNILLSCSNAGWHLSLQRLINAGTSGDECSSEMCEGWFWWLCMLCILITKCWDHTVRCPDCEVGTWGIRLMWGNMSYSHHNGMSMYNCYTATLILTTLVFLVIFLYSWWGN